jgi:hypothetical protein
MACACSGHSDKRLTGPGFGHRDVSKLGSFLPTGEHQRAHHAATLMRVGHEA